MVRVSRAVCLVAALCPWWTPAYAHSSVSADLEDKWGTDWSFSGITTFANLPHVKCLVEADTHFDIGIIGVPFDTAVSYRPGARFGPRAVRASSTRQISFRSFNYRAGINPYTSWARILDCGDMPVTPFDNALALRQMTEGYAELGTRSPPGSSTRAHDDQRTFSKLVSIGGDHSIVLPALRALRDKYGRPIAVLHFDAHLDTWHPAEYPSSWIDDNPGDADSLPQSYFTHGSMFWLAAAEGLIANQSAVHAGLRTRLSGNDYADLDDDSAQGWYRITADEIDDIGTHGIVKTILGKLGTQQPVYLSVDIDVLDPGNAPATGTPEPGGWTTRELIRILRGVEDLNLVGADVVEVSPSYDGPGDITSLAAAQIAYEIITSMVKRGAPREEVSEVGEHVAKDEL